MEFKKIKLDVETPEIGGVFGKIKFTVKPISPMKLRELDVLNATCLKIDEDGSRYFSNTGMIEYQNQWDSAIKECIVDWTGFSLDGEAMPCTPENKDTYLTQVLKKVTGWTLVDSQLLPYKGKPTSADKEDEEGHPISLFKYLREYLSDRGNFEGN